MEELRKHLGTYMSQDPDLVGIILSDREGVPLLRVTTPECPDSVSRISFLSSFAGTSQEVGGKLGLGRNNTLVAVYGNYQVIHHQHQSVVMTLIGKVEASTGLLMNMTETLQPFLSDISAVISDA